MCDLNNFFLFTQHVRWEINFSHEREILRGYREIDAIETLPCSRKYGGGIGARKVAASYIGTFYQRRICGAFRKRSRCDATTDASHRPARNRSSPKGVPTDLTRLYYFLADSAPNCDRAPLRKTTRPHTQNGWFSFFVAHTFPLRFNFCLT